MRWQGKKVFVTGAGGFIGSHLCEALVATGAEVTALIHYNGRGEIGNIDFLPLKGVLLNKFLPIIWYHLTFQLLIDQTRPSPLRDFRGTTLLQKPI